MRTSSFSLEVQNEMAALYTAGESLRNIGLKFNANPQTVRRLIGKMGIVVRPRGRPRKSESTVDVVAPQLAPPTETIAPEGPATTGVVRELPQAQRVVSF